MSRSFTSLLKRFHSSLFRNPGKISPRGRAARTAQPTLEMLETRLAPADATHFLLSGIPANVPAGALMTVTITARDQNGLLDTTWPNNSNLTFSSSDAQAVLPANDSVSLFQGTGSFQAKLLTAGTQTLRGQGCRCQWKLN